MSDRRKAMIFAAGLGTRLKPLTDTMPKALVPFQGQPLLETVIKRLKDNNFTDLVINIHHFGEQIIDFVSQKECFNTTISFSDERDLLRDTGGGIKYAKQHLSEADYFLVHNVDIISDLDLDSFYKECSSRMSLATLVVSQRTTSRYLLFNEEMRLVGWTNKATGEVRSPFSEIAQLSSEEAVIKYKPLAFAGIHLVSNKVFPLMEEWPEKFSIIDFYLWAAKDQYIYGWEAPAEVSIRDIGKLGELT